MNKALQEALHTIPKHRLCGESEALLAFKDTFSAKSINNGKWLTMPRKFTRCATRFTLPINTQKLSTLTPFEYLSQFVWISDHRKQLYRFVFNKYVVEYDDAVDNDNDSNNVECETPIDNVPKKSVSYCQYIECVMLVKDLRDAFFDVLGYCGTTDHLAEQIVKLTALVQLNSTDSTRINYRSWCGLVAFAERFLNLTSFDEDPCDEVEIADFETLEQKSRYVIIAADLKAVLDIIRYNSTSVREPRQLRSAREIPENKIP